MTSFGAPRADVDMTGLSTDYDSSIGTDVDILQDVRYRDIQIRVYPPAPN